MQLREGGGVSERENLRNQSSPPLFSNTLLTEALFTGPRVESLRQVTHLQSNVDMYLHENSSQAGSAPLAG